MSKELLEQAIEKLKRLKAESTQGEWVIDSHGELAVPDYWVSRGYAGPALNEEDAELIVTLHRTIDPILDMLEHCVQWLNDAENNGLSSKSPVVEVEIEAEVNIAKAILGVEL